MTQGKSAFFFWCPSSAAGRRTGCAAPRSERLVGRVARLNRAPLQVRVGREGCSSGRAIARRAWRPSRARKSGMRNPGLVGVLVVCRPAAGSSRGGRTAKRSERAPRRAPRSNRGGLRADWGGGGLLVGSHRGANSGGVGGARGAEPAERARSVHIFLSPKKTDFFLLPAVRPSAVDVNGKFTAALADVLLACFHKTKEKRRTFMARRAAPA